MQSADYTAIYGGNIPFMMIREFRRMPLALMVAVRAFALDMTCADTHGPDLFGSQRRDSGCFFGRACMSGIFVVPVMIVTVADRRQPIPASYSRKTY